MGRALGRAGVLIGLVGVLALSCEKAADADDDDEGASAAAEAFTSELVDALCTLAFACCYDFERSGIGSTERECRLILGGQLDMQLTPNVEALLDAGRARYDEAAFTDCLDDALAKGCSAPQTAVECVFDGVKGLIVAGDACEVPGECADGACLGYADGEGPIATCGSPVASGAPCSGYFDCASQSCVNGSCRAQVPDGGSCVEDTECVSRQCDAGFACMDQRSAFCVPFAASTGPPSPSPN